jgi:LPPG:FO 2-phospho-L-lactate transferase
MGLCICPDVDTICYTLAGLANPTTGWGRQAETFQTLENIHTLGGPDWFQIGDKDLGTHLERTRRLKEGQSLSQITQHFCQVWGVRHLILPMSDQPVHTMVDTLDAGELPFQEYFVHRNCEPKVRGFRFAGIESAQPAPGVLISIKESDAVVFCPSNPWVSIDPILALPGLRPALAMKTILAVSPIIGGQTVKGPAAKMYTELGIIPSALAVARHYADLLSGFIIDIVDQSMAREFSIPVTITQTLMKTNADRYSLAQDVLHLVQSLQTAVQ